jgi:hypothetical protein
VLTLLARTLLFFSAFSPLFTIWALRAWSSVSWVFIALAAAGVIGTIGVLRTARRDEGDPSEILSIESRDADVAAYVVTYLVPFVTTAAQTWQDWLAMILFVIILFVLYTSSDLLAVNPLLALRGLRLYRAKTRPQGRLWLLGPRGLRAEEAVDVAPLYGGVYLVIRKAA